MRKENAIRAYHEWMPTRSGTFGQPGYIGANIARTFYMGDLATIQCLEMRVTVRPCSNHPLQQATAATAWTLSMYCSRIAWFALQLLPSSASDMSTGLTGAGTD